jgi:hypothetical protein
LALFTIRMVAGVAVVLMLIWFDRLREKYY